MSDQHSSSATEHFNKLIQFRQAAYGHFGNGRDALFELTDAVIQMRQIQSFAELSCAPAFRRKWPSAYEALQDGQPDRTELMQLYLHPFGPRGRLLLVGDHTAWPHLWSRTLAGCSYQHQPTPIPGRRPITIGQGYATLGILPEAESPWALPVLHERIRNQRPVEKAAEQLRQICQYLVDRPISLWDAEYGCAAFLLATADVAADKLIRLRANLCLEGPTKPRKKRGRQPKHGIKFNFKDESTWWAPDQRVEYVDPQFGPVVVCIWSGLRFKEALDCRMIVAQVERQQATGSRRKPKVLWFAWIGAEPPEHWWRLYAQRYRIEHWYRFAKGRLHWTLPMFSTPEQCDRWSDLIVFITWELWLAHSAIPDNPLPWQKRQIRLSPGRVCQGMQNILVAIGTPARMCKSRGKSPGWPKGKVRKPREHFELIRSEKWKTIRERKKAIPPGQNAKRGRPKASKTVTVA